MQLREPKNTRQLEKTRQRLADLHVALTDRLYEIFHQQGLMERRSEMADVQLRQQCLSHPFDPITRLELEVIVAEMQHLHGAITRLDKEMAAQKEREERELESRAAVKAEPAPEPAADPFRYGAPELKRSAHRNLIWALAIAASVHFAIIGGYWLAVYLQPVEEKPRVVRITKYMELEPPPSISDEGSGPSSEGPNILGGTASGHLDIFSALGEIIPVKSKEGAGLLVDDATLQRLDRLLNQGMVPGGGTGLGKNGSGRGSGAASYDQVELGDFNLEDSGKIDQLIADARQVETIKLEKKGQVNIESAGRMRGSEAAVTRRTAESVMKVINSQQARMMYVYNKYLRANSELSGKISLDLTIDADGTVSKVAIVESNFTDADFNRELLGIFRRLRFEPIPEGSVTVNLPLVFNRNE